MTANRGAATTRIELLELVRTQSNALILAKKLALFLTVLVILLTLTAFLSGVLLLINVPAKLVSFDGMSPFTILASLLAAGFAFAVIPGLFTYFTLPGIYDRDLGIAKGLPTGDGAPLINHEINRKLTDLDRELHKWKNQGLIKKHGDVFLSEEIQSNVVTYGNLDRARVVYAVDVLANMSPLQLRSILAHETGHIESNDYIVLCLFSEVTKILHYLYVPFQILCLVIKLLFGFLERLPLGVLRYIISGLSFVIRFLIHVISLPLWLPRALLFWESQLAEYLADDFGVALSGSASGLITSLMKLENMRIEVGRSGFKRRYDLFATVVEHSRTLETNSAIGDLVQFLGELESSHPQSVRRWNRLAHIGFQDERIR